jgi:hypothetical protein
MLFSGEVIRLRSQPLNLSCHALNNFVLLIDVAIEWSQLLINTGGKIQSIKNALTYLDPILLIHLLILVKLPTLEHCQLTNILGATVYKCRRPFRKQARAIYFFTFFFFNKKNILTGI